MKVDERVGDPRPWKKRVLLRGRSLITERISRQKTLGWVESLEGTGSEWAAGARVHPKRTPVVQRLCADLNLR